MNHINFSVEDDDAFAACAACGISTDLPRGRGSPDWPPTRRQRLGAGWIEVTPCHPGTDVPIQPPRWQALTDFLAEHRHCAADAARAVQS